MGAAAATTNVDGHFAVTAAGVFPFRISIKHSDYVERLTWARQSDPQPTVTMIPRTFNLEAFDDAWRGPNGTRRWMEAPALVVITRVLQAAWMDDAPIVLEEDVPEAVCDGIVADLRDAFLKLTDGRVGDLASVTFESPAPGDRVPIFRDGVITVARHRGLVAATGGAGTARTHSTDGVIVKAAIALDRDYDERPSATQTRQHEMGHCVGFGHVTWHSVMNFTLKPRVLVTEWDTQAARIAYQRPPKNEHPDADPQEEVSYPLLLGPFSTDPTERELSQNRFH